MVRTGNLVGTRKTIANLAELEKEMHRLQESKKALIQMADKLGLSAPRSCCPHHGKTPCVSCSSDWLVSNLHVLTSDIE